MKLFLVQCDAPASVIIKNVDRRTWKAALAYADAYFDVTPGRIDCRAQAQPRLTREEVRGLDAFPRAYYPATGSALFRRHLALDRPYWFQVWTADGAWKVERPSNVESSADALVFLDPVFGLKTAVRTELFASYAYLAEDARRSAGSGGGIRLQLRQRREHPGEVDNSVSGLYSGIDAWLAWSAIAVSSGPGSV
ncbi:hypothetical protein ACGFKZ_28695 [Micromonospora tulbaghiae]|uniref:hypothetical protein n=1 Tax=Micromonospora TaxID=1873 RepID=UPI0013154341|nr:hypothetical protein [Micromonospora sp. BL1]